MQKTFLVPYKKLISSNKKTKYMVKIGSIKYPIVKTQIDITFAILMVSNFAKNPGLDHFSTINQILRYLTDS